MTPLRLIPLILIVGLQGCVTHIKNTYNIDGNSNTIKAVDTATATPTARDLLDLTGSGYGSAESKK